MIMIMSKKPYISFRITTIIPLSRFHYAKAVYARIKGKFKLGSLMRPHGSPAHKLISNRLRQYMSLPLLKPEDIEIEVRRIGHEIHKLALKHCSPTVVKSLNGLHNYIISYWMVLQGPENFSVFDSNHKTNNLSERLI